MFVQGSQEDGIAAYLAADPDSRGVDFPVRAYRVRSSTPLPPADSLRFGTLVDQYDDAYIALQRSAHEFRTLSYELQNCGDRIYDVQRHYVESGRLDLASTIHPIVSIGKPIVEVYLAQMLTPFTVRNLTPRASIQPSAIRAH